jgi:hypothetical protein
LRKHRCVTVLLLVALLTASALGLAVVVAERDPLLVGYEAVEVGMPADRVLALLGPPDQPDGIRVG